MLAIPPLQNHQELAFIKMFPVKLLSLQARFLE